MGRVEVVDVSAGSALGLQLLQLDVESSLWVLALLAEQILFNKSRARSVLNRGLLVEGFKKGVIRVLALQDRFLLL
jgi:hypothetical protein